MKITARKAVSPIIATLLLIAIAVAAGIIVYVYVNSLAGGLTQSGGQQVTEQIAMDAYCFNTPTCNTSNNMILYVRNTGSATITLDSTALFYDGTPTVDSHTGGTGSSCYSLSPSYQIPTGTRCYISFAITSPTAGTSHLVKAVTLTGGTFVFTVVAGRSG